MRGLKHVIVLLYLVALPVAPLAGAWIETARGRDSGAKVGVAPLAGAWIETQDGLHLQFSIKVAPLAGAWIETGNED